ncbi:MAG: hypothetical protein ACK4ZW_08480 [Blastomonas sp.]
MSGFAAISRGMLDHPLFDGDSARAGAWLWMVLRACWKPTPYDVGGKIITLERGQLCASRAQMAKAWGWSPSAVERFLARLQTEQMIGRATGQGKSIITICNYAKYQDISDRPEQPTEQPTGQLPDSDRTTKEQGNQLTKEGKRETPRAETQIPDDWQPSEFGPDTKSREIVDSWTEKILAHQLEHFAAHHRKRGDKFKDWQAAWSTWVLNSRKFGNGTNNRSGGSASSAPRSNDGFLNACVDAAMGGHDPGDPFGRPDDGTRDDSGGTVLRLAAHRPR